MACMACMYAIIENHIEFIWLISQVIQCVKLGTFIIVLGRKRWALRQKKEGNQLIIKEKVEMVE